MIIDTQWDPPAPRWLCWYCEGACILCLLVLVMDLYLGRWPWAAENFGCGLLNACNAYFNRLPVSQRTRIIDCLKFWRRGEDS